MSCIIPNQNGNSSSFLGSPYKLNRNKKDHSASLYISPNKFNESNMAKIEEKEEELDKETIDKNKRQKNKNNLIHKLEIKKLLTTITSTSRFLSKTKSQSMSSTNFSIFCKNSKIDEKSSNNNKISQNSSTTNYPAFKTSIFNKTMKKFENNEIGITTKKIKFDLPPNVIIPALKHHVSILNPSKNSKNRENQILLVKHYQSTIDEMNMKSKKEHLFSNPESLKNHLIRDHKIGDFNHVSGSRKKYESTMKVYSDIETKKLSKIEQDVLKSYKIEKKANKFIISEESFDEMEKETSMNEDDEYNETNKEYLKRVYVC